MPLFNVIALHIVDLFPTCFGRGGIVTTCVLLSVRIGDDPRETGVQPESDDTLTRDGKSDNLSS